MKALKVTLVMIVVLVMAGTGYTGVIKYRGSSFDSALALSISIGMVVMSISFACDGSVGPSSQ